MSDYMRRLRGKIGTDLVVVPSVTILAFDDQGRVLLARHAETGQWVAPGGAVEPHERPADAAVREMWEETGVHVELTRLLGVYGGPEFHVVYRNGDQASYVMVVFEARPLAGEPRADGVETLEVRWVAPAEADAIPVSVWVRLLLADAVGGRHRAHFHPPAWTPPGAAGTAGASGRP